MQAIKITDGRTSLWQWDTGVRIKVYGCTDVDQMHFVTPGGIISRELVDGECGVPDTALQTSGLLKMYAFDRTGNGGVTRCDFLLMVKERPKPADYIDPPDEYDNLEELAKRVAPLIPGGGGEPVTPEQIQQAVDNYLTENPVQVEETDPNVPDWAKAEQKPSYTAEEVGAQPKGNYALKSDIPEISVKSVNGKTGDVVLTAQNVGALPADAEIVDQTARDGVATLSEEKFDKHQGAENANKLLMVAQTGGIIGAEVGEGLEVKDRLGKNIFHGEWENARYNNGSFTTVTSGKHYIAVRELFPVKPNTAYTISRQTAPNCAEIFIYMQQFSANKSWISGTSSIAGDDFVKVASKSFTTGENTHFLAIYCYAPKGESWQDMIPGGLMIEEGTTATQYEEYGVIGVEIKLKDANVIPSYWDDQIEQKIASVNSLHKELGKDCFSFVAIADMHYMHNLGKCSPRLAKKIMDACDIKYAYALGDFTGSGSLNQKDKLLEEMENVETMLSPIRDRLLVVQGNHDGTWGSVDQNADGTITSPERNSYIITPGEMHHWLFRKVGLIGNVHFDETGTAYYIDDTASRVRYIALNSSCLDYELDNNGYSKYNAMAMFRFTQKQYDFLVEALMDGLDERWSVVIGAHAPLVAYETMWNGETGVEYTLMRDFLTAFRNKTTFSGSFAGTADNGFDDVSIEADFTKAEATLVGYFAGHIHDDYHYPHTTHGIDMIGTGADRQREEMTAGTDTEQSFDVVTVDKKNHKIYCTKIGFGDDRVISYD